MKTVAQTFKIKQAARLTGLSPYMVDYFCRSGILTPSASKTKPGRGIPRFFTFGDLVLMKVLVKLLEAGIPVYRLSQAVKGFQRRYPRFHPSELPGSLLITDGKKIYLKKHDLSALEELSSGQLSFAFVVEIEMICKEIAVKISEATA